MFDCPPDFLVNFNFSITDVLEGKSRGRVPKP